MQLSFALVFLSEFTLVEFCIQAFAKLLHAFLVSFLQPFLLRLEANLFDCTAIEHANLSHVWACVLKQSCLLQAFLNIAQNQLFVETTSFCQLYELDCYFFQVCFLQDIVQVIYLDLTKSFSYYLDFFQYCYHWWYHQVDPAFLLLIIKLVHWHLQLHYFLENVMQQPKLFHHISYVSQQLFPS